MAHTGLCYNLRGSASMPRTEPCLLGAQILAASTRNLICRYKTENINVDVQEPDPSPSYAALKNGLDSQVHYNKGYTGYIGVIWGL